MKNVLYRDDDDAAVAFESIHLGKDLVQGLLLLVVAAARPGTPTPALLGHRVDLVDEDDARRVLLGLGENVAHAAVQERVTDQSSDDEITES
jgi:hypothetical protein